MGNRSVRTHAAKSSLNDIGTGPVTLHGAPSVSVFVVFGAGTSAGAVQLEASPDGNFSGTWAAVGAPVAWSAASKVERASFNEAHRYVRARISTAIVGGTVDVYVVTGGFAPAEYQDP